MKKPSRKSPQAKKREDYDRAHRTLMENPHAFRKNWPKKKARANRRERVKARTIVATAPDDDRTAGAVKSVRQRNAIRKGSVMTVREYVAVKKDQRVRLAGRRVRKSQES